MKDNRLLLLLKKYWVIPAVALIALAAVFSSVEIYKEEVLNIDPDVKYQKQKTLYFAAESIDTLNPLISQSEDTYYLSKLIYNSLFEYDENLSAVPELVDSYTVNTERAYIEMTLKKGVKWHNGKTLKADDVRFTVNAIKAAGSTSPYYAKASKIVAVNVTGTYQCNIYFNNNYNCSLDDLTFPIVPSSQYGNAYQFAKAADGFKPVGTGMYQYRSYNYLKYLRLNPNEDYFDKEQKADNKIYVNIIPKRSLAENLMEIDTVTCYLDDSSARRSIVSDKNYRMYDVLSNQVEMIVYNTKSKMLKNKDVRQAVSYGIDREKILANAYMGDGVLSDTIYYPNYLGVADEGTAYAYDYQKAQQMLLSAGLADRNGDGTLEDMNGDAVTLRIVVNKKNATRTAAARLIEKNLETIGIRSEVRALTTKAYQAAISACDFDILLTGYRMEESYDLRSFFDRTNPWGYINYDLLASVRELSRLHTEAEYREAFAALKTQMLDEMPYYPLCYRYTGLIGVTTFKAEALPMFNDIYKNCNTWSWSKVIKPETQEEEADAEVKSEQN